MVIIGLVSIPLALTYLGDERFGIWMTIVGTVQIIRVTDLGLGNGLISQLSALRETEHNEQARKLVTSVSISLLCVSAIILSIFEVANLFLDWGRIFGATSSLARLESGPTMTVVVVLYSVDFALNIVRATHKAYQEEYINNIWRSGGSVLGLILMFLGIKLKLNMPALVGFFMSGTILSDLCNGVHLFWRGHPKIRPSIRYFSWTTAKSVTSVGGWFLVMQIAVAIQEALPRLTIAHTLGAAVVAPFAIVERVFCYLRFVVGIVVGPLWPAYAEANEKGDYVWMKLTLRRTLVLCIAASVVAVAAPVIAGEWGFELIARKELSISRGLVAGFAVFTVAYAWVQVFNSFVVGVGRIRSISLSLVAQTLMLGAAIYPITKVWGSNGAIIAMLASLLLTCAWIYPTLAWQWMKNNASL